MLKASIVSVKTVQFQVSFSRTSLVLSLSLFAFDHDRADSARGFFSYRGNLAWTQALPWIGQNEYVLSKAKPYRTKAGKKVGTTRSVGNGAGLLRWLEVAESGHLTPHGMSFS